MHLLLVERGAQHAVAGALDGEGVERDPELRGRARRAKGHGQST